MVPVDGEVTFRLESLGSTNGVLLNGKSMAAGEIVPLHSRDVVALGDVTLLFLDARALFEHLPELIGPA